MDLIVDIGIHLGTVGAVNGGCNRHTALCTSVVGKEIVAVIGIRIAGVDELRAVVFPRGGTLCIEQDIVARTEDPVGSFFHIETDSRQVVNLGFVEVLRQHSAAIAVHTYIGGVA